MDHPALAAELLRQHHAREQSRALPGLARTDVGAAYAIQRDLVRLLRAEANAAFLKSLRKRYRVVVAGVDN